MKWRGSKLIEEYAAGQAKMRRVRDGAALLAAARELLERLPAGELTLAATSLEGVALAAVCSALRDEPTDWTRIDLTAPRPTTIPEALVVIEPVGGGAGWRGAVEAHYPGALILVVDAAVRIPTA
jgi:hypothetical protein